MQRKEPTKTTLPWVERPSRELVRLAWPIVISFLSYSVMTLVGTMFVGHLGASALAGVGLGAMAAFALLCFAFGVMRGLKTLVAQAVGAKDTAQIGALRSAGLWLALFLGITVLVAAQLLAPVLPALATSESSGHQAVQYFTIRILASPALLVYVALREYRYALGDSRSAMVASVLGNGANIVTDAVLILGLKWGVVGAGWGTVAGHIVEVAFMVSAQRSEGFGALRLSTRPLRAILVEGLPSGLQFELEFGSFALLGALIASMGDSQMAAHQIAVQTIHFVFLPSVAISEAASVLAGQAVGGNRDDLVRRVARTGALLAVLYASACTLVLFAFPRQIAAAFTTDGPTLVIATALFRVAGLFSIADAVNIVARGVLRGAGDVRWSAAIGVFTAWVMTPPGAWLFGLGMGLGAVGGWLGLAAECFVGAVILWLRVERGHWEAHAQRARSRLTARDDAEALVVAA